MTLPYLVRPVELASSEFGVVGHIDALVSELPADLVHAVQATDHQLLRIDCDWVDYEKKQNNETRAHTKEK